ncbi:hypothetical protein BABINDRAFT_161599 [Babjeviella inositovora NRRL Y-12698]|uniref:Amidase domain-containing protein n=1 Tax=Babjeviella inositovora NRRL Y-12698 TaxID=984486 RepID=A0A1E3QQH2_9ASCO|nr:uncharacterized protein BABINDRAFT_161599 [Babjeviella inositovora NRRL Y-12698]ODQ79933.1 hypothetical protein BABINDRAFT_161599 [Babjeviella inositovora NRRL Y-12698]
MTASINFIPKVKDTYNKELFETEWVPRIKKYQEALAASIPKELALDESQIPSDLDTKAFNAIQFMYDQKLLTEKEFAFTDLKCVDLAAKIASGELTSVEVFKAFAKKAVICHQFTHCANEFFIDEGLARAKELDAYFAEHGKTVGPFHGLPISLKEQLGYKGKITHAGYVAKLVNVPEESAVTIQILEKLGGVFYIRTVQPQTLMHLDSMNNITGRARNPYNSTLSPGGSSSGEGSISAFRAAALSVGTDIGGSVRGPAAFSGSQGLRCTTRRVSTLGGLSSGLGQESVLGIAGPMSTHIDDLRFFMENYINLGKPWEYDAWSLPIPWRTGLVPGKDQKKVKIAIMYDDEVVKPLPPIERGLKYAAEKLGKVSNIELVEFKPIKTQLANETVLKLYSIDGNYRQKSLLAPSGEPMVYLSKWSLSYGDGDEAGSVTDNRNLNSTRDSLRNEYNKFMVDNQIDFILTANYNNVAPKPERIYNWSYTSLFNLLDMPALAFQTGLFQDPTVDVIKKPRTKFRSDVEELEWSLYNPEDFRGAPIALQLVGRRYFDEEVLNGGQYVFDILNQH